MDQKKLVWYGGSYVAQMKASDYLEFVKSSYDCSLTPMKLGAPKASHFLLARVTVDTHGVLYIFRPLTPYIYRVLPNQFDMTMHSPKGYMGADEMAYDPVSECMWIVDYRNEKSISKWNIKTDEYESLDCPIIPARIAVSVHGTVAIAEASGNTIAWMAPKGGFKKLGFTSNGQIYIRFLDGTDVLVVKQFRDAYTIDTSVNSPYVFEVSPLQYVFTVNSAYWIDSIRSLAPEICDQSLMPSLWIQRYLRVIIHNRKNWYHWFCSIYEKLPHTSKANLIALYKAWICSRGQSPLGLLPKDIIVYTLSEFVINHTFP